MNSERIKKLESVSENLLRQFIFEESREINDEFGLISVVGTRISSDLSYLDVYVSCLKNKEKLPKALAYFGFNIQRKLNKALNIRKLPKIRFRYNEEGETAFIISQAINNLNIPQDVE